MNYFFHFHYNGNTFKKVTFDCSTHSIQIIPLISLCDFLTSMLNAHYIHGKVISNRLTFDVSHSHLLQVISKRAARQGERSLSSLKFPLFHHSMSRCGQLVTALGWESEGSWFKCRHLQATFEPGLPQHRPLPKCAFNEK